MSNSAGRHSSSIRASEQSRHLVNSNESRRHRDIRQVAPQSASLYDYYNKVDESSLVNRLQDKARNAVIASGNISHFGAVV